ncbi:lipopolysaccharide biosynthesis protein [Sphingomonas sp. LB-2]|uniref:lipopolysaccharide biosynthesis protein n=1 Tax=Sphingomonas caeni TaxID=2984949 RepID=UPI0022309C39|nr:lipopolysaccharide biosynthesis protein [Sphingomonas caeni]MCW3846753.1 lipopolysaccharide biosynthesis protein [Sphingomonas caeni]
MTGQSDDINALAKGGRTNIMGFVIRLAGRVPFLFIAGRWYGPEIVGRFALAVLVIEIAALLATLGLKRGLAQALSTTSRPHSHVVADALMVALAASLCATGVLVIFPEIMFPNSPVKGLEGLLPLIVFALAWCDVAFSALAYRHNVGASVTARAIVEPWTISGAAFALAWISSRDGLIIAYVLAELAMLIAAMVPLVRMYGMPHGWRPHPAKLWHMARANAPLAGADALEWGTRNIDRFILGLLFPPAFVGIYYMAQQFASLAQRLKTTFDPILGPVITRSLAAGDKEAVAKQVRQVAFWVTAVQAAIAISIGITSDGVMGLLGPKFVAGSAALCILLAAEVLAAPGAIAEGGLVYVARHRNLMISATLLGFQAVLSFVLVFAAREMGYPPAYQAVGPALALAGSLALGSVIKAWLLSHLLGKSVSGLRWGLFAAMIACAGTGVAISKLPEWLQLTVGTPLMLAVYFFVLLKLAFGPEDRALFRKMPKEQEPVIDEITN